MSQSRFILKQITVGGSGASDLTRYVSRSKLDHEKEGRAARPLWSAQEDNLTVTAARRWLSIVGDKWDKKDVLHYVLSFGNEREYELLGDDEKERREVARDFLRHSLQAGLAQQGIAEMRWVAGAHRNKPNPHIHLLLNRTALTAEGELWRLSRLPRALVAHHNRSANGPKEFTYGALISAFAEQVDDRHRARHRVLRYAGGPLEWPLERELLAPETLRQRLPNAAERLVGEWLKAEIMALPAPALDSPTTLSRDGLNALANKHSSFAGTNELAALRAQVSRLDRHAEASGLPRIGAYIPAPELRELLALQPPPAPLQQMREIPLPEREVSRTERATPGREHEVMAPEHEAPKRDIETLEKAPVVSLAQQPRSVEHELPGTKSRQPDGPLPPEQLPTRHAPPTQQLIR